MKVIVCGGRRYYNTSYVNRSLNNFHTFSPITKLIHGGASGADALAKQWAIAHGVEHIKYAADWTTYGRAAGPIRNQRMLDEEKPDVVIAFPGGTGTASMMRLADKAGVTVIELKELT